MDPHAVKQRSIMQKQKPKLGRGGPTIQHALFKGVAYRPAAAAAWVNNETLKANDNEKDN
jgi:hypothetical protein